MKLILLTTAIILNSCSLSFCQDSFDAFVKEFSVLEAPIKSVEKIHNDDTLNINFANKILVTDQELPYYIRNNEQIEEDNYYGQIMKGNSNYNIAGSGKTVEFSTKAYSIGRINLSSNYISLIIKVIALESTFYDIYNFTKDGELKSFLPLYLGYRNAPHEEVSFLVIESGISESGEIQWHESIDGRETKRTYVLNDDGYFEIISEEVSGEAEY